MAWGGGYEEDSGNMQNMKNIKYLLLVCAASVATAGISGCSWYREKTAEQTGRTTQMVAQDEDTAKLVNSSLRNSSIYKFNQVSVRTYNGTVQLSGFVGTEDQKRAAGEIAQQVVGPGRVMNGISVQAPLITPTGRPAFDGTNAPSGTP